MSTEMAAYRKVFTLFDHVSPSLINLAMGAPSKPLLQSCTEVLKKATAHRMVEQYFHLDFVSC